MVLFLALMLSFVTAESCNLNVELINQDPYPATPDDYVKVVFQVSGLDNNECEGTKFQFVENFPFSLDADDGLRTIEGSTFVSNYKNEWLIPFKIRVDKDAIDGENELKVNYGDSASFGDIVKYFDVFIEKSRTDFDVVVQEISESEVTIAIANIGENIAESVIVRLPEQDYFEAIGTNGQMIGNLENGDYTLVGFDVKPILNKNTNNELNLKIDYTDTIGERRTVTQSIFLSFDSSPTDADLKRSGGERRGTTSNLVFQGLLVLVVIMGLVIYNRYKRKRKGVKITQADKDSLRKK